MYKLLVVDDDAKTLKATKSFLAANRYEVTTCSNSTEAIEALKNEEFALALFDYQMPDMMGDALVSAIKKTSPHQQIAMYSCDLSRDAIKNSMKAGAVDFIDKSLSPVELLKTVSSFCNRYDEAFSTIRPSKNKSTNRKLIESIGMVGESEALAKVAQQVIKFASASDSSVLIQGESGTGKELIAKALHKLSSRAKGNFVAINCAAIPRELLESELFGHIKGAFTGAVADKVGKFEYANGGTIFLDEIGDMPLDLQVKLLRVLQEREITPVGGKISRKVNVRIVCATHRDLDSLKASGQFRDDLYYRVRVLEINLPPLRLRIDDIEPLVALFTDRFNLESETKKYFQKRTLNTLKKYSWPGNIRELEGMVEEVLVKTSGSMITPSELDPKYFEAPSGPLAPLNFEEYRRRQATEEVNFLQRTIDEAGGSKTEAARRLGITDNHLRHLLKS